MRQRTFRIHARRNEIGQIKFSVAVSPDLRRGRRVEGTLVVPGDGGSIIAAMSDIEAALDDLFRVRHAGTRDDLRPEQATRSIRRLSEGVFRLAYGDHEEQVFLLTVQSVASRRIGPRNPQPIGQISGVEALLVAVVVDTHVHIDVDLGDSPGKALLLAEYRDVHERWLATWPTDEKPPDEPAARLLAVAARITDDLGTEYIFDGGSSGGTGSECRSRRSFRPAPPPTARRLRVALQTPGHDEWTAEFDLTRELSAP
jgi:hypothetical protein